MYQNLLPIGRSVIFTQVGLHFTREDFECGGFPDTVGTDEAEDLARAWHGEAVEFEGVGSVPVGCISFEVLGEVDDLYRLEWTFFDADTTSYIYLCYIIIFC